MLGFKHRVDPASVAAYNTRLQAAAQADPALAAELQKQAHQQPFDSNLVLSKLKAVGLENPPPGSWISGGAATQEPTNPFWTKALPLMAAGVGGAYALPALAGGGGAGAAGAAGGGVGLGETGAVTGLAGSGFGGTAAAGGGVLGALGKYGSQIGDLGDILSGAAGGQANGRRDDDRMNLSAIATNNRALMDMGQFNMDAPTTRTNQVARGEMLNTMQDAPLTGDPRVDKWAGGGLRPSAVGPQSRQAGGELSRQALEALMTKSDRLTPQTYQPGSRVGENILGGVGLGASVLGMLGKFRKRTP